MTAFVPRTPVFELRFGAVIVDLSPHLVAVDIAQDAEVIDIGTFATPKATETGKVTESITLALLWHPTLLTALETHINEVAQMVFKTDPTHVKAIQAQVKYATLPWGRFEVGVRVEDDLVLAVLSTLTAATPPALLREGELPERIDTRPAEPELAPVAA